MWKTEDKIEYFLKTWEWAGVGYTVASVADGPDTCVILTTSDLEEIIKRIRDLEHQIECSPVIGLRA